jgi:hypothetical protein
MLHHHLKISSIMKSRLLLIALLVILFEGFTACTKEDDDDPQVTPKTQELNANITTETTLKDLIDDPGAIDYLVTKSNLAVQKGLIVEPGVVIAFEADTKLTMENDGYLKAVGTVAKPIKFTGKEKAAGFWRGICFFTVDTRNELAYCTVEYGGGGSLAAATPLANIGICAINGLGSSCKITNTVSAHSKGMGIYASKHSEVLAFSNNTLSNNTLAAMSIGAGSANILDSSTSFDGNNGYNGVEIQGGQMNEQTETTWRGLKNGATYKLTEKLELYSGLVIAPGVTIEAEANTSLEIDLDNGYLTAIGTPSQKIVFQGFVKNAGFWKGVIFESNDTRNTLVYCVVEHGGSADMGSGLGKSNIGMKFLFGEVCTLRIENCLIQNGSGCGISKNANTQLTQSGNTFQGLASGNICQ